jgi:Ca2+-transporting ATPase
MNIILFLALVFLATFLLGRLLERIRIPWIFSALLIGLAMAAYNPFHEITSSSSFEFLARLGMYFLLFIIGFEIDIKEIAKNNRFVFKATFVIILTEAFFGTLFVHYIFAVPWMISILVGISFATVGEAVLLPILDEFRLTRTRLGQTILGVGVIDDIIEVVTIILLTFILGSTLGHSQSSTITTISVLGGLFVLTFFLSKLKSGASRIHFKGISSLFLFVIFTILLFIGIGSIVEAAALGAILAGISLRNFIPKKKWKIVDSEIKTMAYGFFAPLFFLWVGIDTDIGFIFSFPLLVLAMIALTKSIKIVTSYLIGRKELGSHRSIIMGIGLSVKFSTSIVIVKLLFENGLIPLTLYSVLIGATIFFKFIVPFLMSQLIIKWKISG